MIKIYTLYNQVNFTSEQIILFGLLDTLPAEPQHCYNHKNESRYKGIIDFCKKNINYVNTPEECDIIVLPYKFKDITDINYINLNTLSKELNKPLWCFYNDDDDKQFNISSNVILFRTSFYKISKLHNEYPMIVFSPDYFNNKFTNDLSIGYCGHLNNGRDKYLKILYHSDIKTNFIIRNGFWAPGIDKNIARKEYFDNIENNLFTFCYRGAGNFSYRFYETLMMGKIPILINTDCVFPFEDKININDIALVINEKDIDNIDNHDTTLINIIKSYYYKNKDNLLNIQQNNRFIWETYYSPIGFINNIINNNF
jgi:hypothetical protein